MATPGSYWGGHFPEPAEGELSYWGGHFPEPTTSDPGYGPATAAAFQLALDANTQLTLQWQTDVRKSRSGVEQRANLLDRPRQFYRGPMLLGVEASRTARGQLAQYSALGTPLLVGLSYDALAVTAAPATAAVGGETHTTITVPSTALIDWGAGQRVVIDNPGVGAAESVVVSVTSSTIVVNTDVSALAILGARIMPGMPTLLDPQQGFDRYPVEAETWNVTGRAAVFSFAPELVAATLALTGPHTTGATLRALTLGPNGNYTRAQILTDAPTADGTVTVGFVGVICTVTIRIQAGVTTVAQFLDLVAGSGMIELDGTLEPTDVLVFADLLPVTFFSGGASILPEVGQGATLTTFRDLPVWTAGVTIDGTVPDSLQSMHEVEDLGGVPFAVGSADRPEWGRALSMRRQMTDRAAWQWLMRFLDEIRGRWAPFWLSTFATDLAPVSVAVGELMVTGEVLAHWPAQQTCLQIVQADRSVTWVRIDDATDNGDGTVTLDIVDEDDDPVTLVGVPRRVSWLERCRLESDDVIVSFDGEHRFLTDATARVIRESDELLTQPREVFEIVTAAETYLLASGVEDIVVSTQTYSASPIQRAGLTVSDSNGSGEAALLVALPASHPLVERYVAIGAPPTVAMTVRRHDAVLATTEVIWVGNVAAMSCSGNLATFTIRPRGAASMVRRLPIVSAGRTCAHVLYDSRCTVVRASHSVATTVTNINGRVVTVASVGGNPDQWAKYGDLANASGERMLVNDQTGLVLTLRTPLPGLTVGASVTVSAGCAHDAATCSVKFDNVDNFGGFPSMPVDGELRFHTDGLGTYESE